ncbi:nuclear transport factor 2 family protein [Parapedobacter soli]|uniref:nuclear transport factor 2 family protein n=1 Tax=Parapedobacter soli TaxID=416955 RepID=UPI0021C6DAC3|nr:hypothetical protein [Parapedobacter soli]
MTKITIEVDCGNAPKKEFLKNYYIAKANGDIDFVINSISDTINWEVIGNKIITNREEFIGAIQEHTLWKVKELIIDAIITHGNHASVNGRVVTRSNLNFAFCDVYKFKGFKGSKIKSVQTYLIQENGKSEQ